MWKRWGAHTRLKLQNPRDVFWNTLGPQNSPWHERVDELWGGSLLENSTHMVWGGSGTGAGGAGAMC